MTGMSPVPPVPFDSLTALRRTVDEHVVDTGARARTRVLSLCIEAIAFAHEADTGMVATRARSAAHLLLELGCPALDEDALGALSLACERTATSC